MKKPLFIAGIIVCTSLVVLFTALHLNESDSHQESEAKFSPTHYGKESDLLVVCVSMQ